MAVAPLPAFLRQCLLRRLPPDQVVHLLQQKKQQQQQQQQPQPQNHISHGKALFQILVDARHSLCPPGDPLPPRYLEGLFVAQLIPFSDALVVLIARWNASVPKRASAATDISSLQDMCLALLSPRLSLPSGETARCLLLASRWLTTVSRCINNDPDGVDRSLGPLAEACASFLATLSATGAGIAILSPKKASDDRDDRQEKASTVMEAVSQAVDLAIALFPAISAQLMERLAVIQKHLALLVTTTTTSDNPSHGHDAHQPDLLQALQFQASVPEPQMVGSRAATVLYLEAVLFTATTLDDNTLFNFLEGRYCQNYHAIFVDLLFASFHLLHKSFRLGQPYFDHVQIFIRNKLPSVLNSIASNPFAAFTSEQAIAEVWPDLASADVRSWSDVKPCVASFLHVCSLTRLMTEAKRDELIGDSTAVAAATSTKSLLTKDDVVAQVNSGHTRPTQLVYQLTQTDGSAAAIAQAIVQIILTFCQNKETDHLKDLAHAIIRNPDAVNALSLFIRPCYWLSPLCSILDQWRWDEIQGESQPLYDEFGAILLLVLVAQRRLCLTKPDIGITSSSGFVSRYLDHEGTHVTLQDLSQESQKHLGEWINALYVAEGLNDELTTSCSPQQFYLFIPTLLSQSLLALQRGKLGPDSLRGGLEFLLEPFLLPSLVSAISWISACPDATATSSILPILTQSPGSADAQTIHQTIIAMTNSLPQFAFQPPSLSSTPASFAKDMASAISNLATGANLSANFNGLVQDCGLEIALRSVLDILMRYSGTPDFLTALDICSTLVCVVHGQTRDLLKLKAATLGSLLRKNNNGSLVAEVIVHLHRRVEAYASVLLVQDLGIDQFATLQLTNIDQVAGNMEVQPATSSQHVQAADHVDQPMDDIDQVLNESAAMSSMDQVDPSGLNIDDFYGLQNEMGNLDDLDLEMFS